MLQSGVPFSDLSHCSRTPQTPALAEFACAARHPAGNLHPYLVEGRCIAVRTRGAVASPHRLQLRELDFTARAEGVVKLIPGRIERVANPRLNRQQVVLFHEVCVLTAHLHIGVTNLPFVLRTENSELHRLSHSLHSRVCSGHGSTSSGTNLVCFRNPDDRVSFSIRVLDPCTRSPEEGGVHQIGGCVATGRTCRQGQEPTYVLAPAMGTAGGPDVRAGGRVSASP